MKREKESPLTNRVSRSPRKSRSRLLNLFPSNNASSRSMKRSHSRSEKRFLSRSKGRSVSRSKHRSRSPSHKHFRSQSLKRSRTRSVNRFRSRSMKRSRTRSEELSKSHSEKRSRSRSPRRRHRRSRSHSYHNRRSVSRDYGRSRSRGDRAREPAKIFIGNLDHYTDEIDLEEHFKRYGPLEDVYVPRDQRNRSNRGYAFMTFTDRRDAEDACTEDGADLNGRRIGVNIAKRRPGGTGKVRTYIPSRDGEGGSMRAWLGNNRRRSRSRDRRRSRTRSRGRRSRSWR